MSRWTFRLAHCRASERVVIGFFVYSALCSVGAGLDIGKRLAALFLPCAWFALASWETVYGRTATRIARDWVLPACVLTGYWQMGWFARQHDEALQRTWLSWDRHLLDAMHLRAVIESLGSLGPGILEFSYLLLYGIPAICVGVLYWKRQRVAVDRYLVTFALGTLAVYALLPWIPVASPRIAFAGQDLPGQMTVWRAINLWVLNHGDISTSVFPSGHVAVAFSSAFGMRRALPESPRIFLALLGLAVLVDVATIYGRYHYAVDGAASMVICLAAWLACEAYDPAQ